MVIQALKNVDSYLFSGLFLSVYKKMTLSYTQIHFFLFLDKIPLLAGKLCGNINASYTQNRIPAKKDNK